MADVHAVNIPTDQSDPVPAGDAVNIPTDQNDPVPAGDAVNIPTDRSDPVSAEDDVFISIEQSKPSSMVDVHVADGVTNVESSLDVIDNMSSVAPKDASTDSTPQIEISVMCDLIELYLSSKLLFQVINIKL